MKKLSKLASLLAIGLFAVGVIACNGPTDNEISDGGNETPTVPSTPTTPGTGESGGSETGEIGGGGTETPTLPGTAGGSANDKDIFQGKTFYNNAEESKAEVKYVFGTDGTCTYYRKDSSDSDEKWVVQIETKYSLSDDGNTMYQMVNRFPFVDGKLQTHQEVLNDESTKKYVKEGCEWDTQSDDEKSKLLSRYGLSSTATFEQFYQAYLESLFSVSEEDTIDSDAKDDDGKSCIKLTFAVVGVGERSIFLYSTNTN